MLSRLVRALALLVALIAAVPAQAAAPFARDSVWNARLADDAPLVPESAALVAELNRQAAEPGGRWLNTTAYSVPVYMVGPEQPTVRVWADTPYAHLLRPGWDAVPLPPGARPADGSDAHLVVHQPATDTLWEFWSMYETAGGWHARWGATTHGVSSNPGYHAAPLGATATGLAALGGLIRPDELAAGRIEHALAVGIPRARYGAFVWPAQRGDGVDTAPTAIPHGTRFRLDPALDLGALGLTPPALSIARAMQDYGLIVRDQAGAVVLYGEDPKSLGHDPWPALLDEWPDKLLDSLPWERLQVVVPDRRAFATPTPAPATAAPAPAPPAGAPQSPVVAPATTGLTPRLAALPRPAPSATRRAIARAHALCAQARRKGATKRAKAACRRARAAARRTARR
jgi:hypothetical protein